VSEEHESITEVPEQPIRVLIIDDHEVLASSLALVLDAESDITAVGVATTLEQAHELIGSTRPDVLLLDHRMPDGDGVAAIPRLRAQRPSLGIVVLTASAADHVLLSAIENGASGFLSKTRSLDEVTAAVRAAAAGESVISPELLARLLPRFGRGKVHSPDELTEREREVLVLMARGLSNTEIAGALFVAETTVKTHVGRVLHKLGLRDRAQAVVLAYESGLVQPGA